MARTSFRLITEEQLENMCAQSKIPFSWAKDVCPPAPNLDKLEAEITLEWMSEKSIGEESNHVRSVAARYRAEGLARAAAIVSKYKVN